jgi:hypothetical protein
MRLYIVLARLAESNIIYQMKIRKECPTCREKIAQRPTPSFVVKEQVETFVDRLAADERDIAKQRLRAKEDALKRKDDPWDGIFLDPPIVDSDDGVRLVSLRLVSISKLRH